MKTKLIPSLLCLAGMAFGAKPASQSKVPPIVPQKSVCVVTTCAPKFEVTKKPLPDGSRGYCLRLDGKPVGGIVGKNLTAIGHSDIFCIEQWTLRAEYRGAGFEDQFMTEVLKDLLKTYQANNIVHNINGFNVNDYLTELKTK